MTEDRTTRQGDWDRTDWKGEGQDPADTRDDRLPADHRLPADPPADAATGARWTKDQWPGDQGEGAPDATDPDAMPEGENRLSGDRHASGESHFARGQAAKDVS